MTKGFHIENGVLRLYTEREETVVVPKGVHTIGEGAFKGCVSLKKVVLPPGLIYIKAEAFKGCRRLEEVEIFQGVVAIGDYAFHRCHSLKKIHLPFSVEKLGSCAFLYCDSLEEAAIPGVQQIGKQAFLNDVRLKRLIISRKLQEDCICDVFTGCPGLREISFADGKCHRFPNPVEVIAGELAVPELVRVIAVDVLRMMELEGRCLVKFLTNLKHVEIPEGIEKIGKSCFFDKRGILSIKLPKSLKEIGERAFRSCIGLETVIFEGEQADIHEDAFKNCTSLQHIRTSEGTWYELKGIRRPSQAVPEMVRDIHRQILANFRISGTILLKYLGAEPRVVVPEGITVIAQEAFMGNEAVDRVLLPESLQEIGADAFRDCVLLQTIQFPEGLRRIGKGAFENCIKLIRASLPDKLMQIEDGVFKYCQVLREVSFKEGLEEIGEQAFYGCHSLKEVVFPESLLRIGKMAFYRCKSLKEVSLPQGMVTMGSLAFAQSGVKKACLRDSGEGYGTGIFSGCQKLKTLIFEENVRHIADKFAYGCPSLKRVILPDTLVSVGRNVWENTPFLQDWLMNGQEGDILWDGQNLEGEVKIPENIRILAGGAFYGNTSLTTVSLPEKISWVGEAAFKGCKGLRRVFWRAEEKEIRKEVFSGCLRLEEVENCTSWQAVQEQAFKGCRALRKIWLETVQYIGREAFFGCQSLEQSTLKEKVWIGERAFEDSSFLSNEAGQPRVLAGTIISAAFCEGEIQLPEGLVRIAPYAFARNCQITRVILPESLLEIGEGAFWGCSSLMDIQFPQRTCKIGERAFEKCTALKRVFLRAEDMGRSVFAFCTALESIRFIGTKLLKERLLEGCINLKECHIEGVKEVKAWCFEGCESLESFDFTQVKKVGKYAFQNCNSLKRAEFGDGVLLEPHAFEDCGRLEEVCLMGEVGDLCLKEYALSGCTALRRVRAQGKIWELSTYADVLSENIPEQIRLIFQSALSCFAVDKEEILCGYLGAGRIVRIPEGIRRIEAEVFRDVLMLEEIEIPKSVEYIGARAFHGTAWLEGLRQASPLVVVNDMLLDGSGVIGEAVVAPQIRLVCGWAFANGMGIEKIRFMSEKVRVEEYAFRNCIYLKEITMADKITIALTGIGDRKKALPPLVKQAVMDALNCFKTDEDDRLVECTGNIARLRIADGIRAIGDGVFQEGNLLAEVVLSLTVKSIGKGAFSGCKWLRMVHQAQGVEEIGARAFSGCGALERVELSENLHRIEARAFEHCTLLKEILIPEGVEEIADKTFYRCHSLEEVYLPSTVKRIGKEAFAFCRQLRVISLSRHTMVEENAFKGCGQLVRMEKRECVIEI